TLKYQYDFVDVIEQVGQPPSEGILDQGDRLTIRRLAQIDGHHRPSRLEARVRGTLRQVVLENADELAEVGIDPVTAGALALLDDDLDGAACRCQVGHRRQLRPLEDLGRRLRFRWADEHPGLAVTIHQVSQSGIDAPVQVTDRVPFLRTG